MSGNPKVALRRPANPPSAATRYRMKVVDAFGTLTHRPHTLDGVASVGCVNSQRSQCTGCSGRRLRGSAGARSGGAVRRRPQARRAGSTGQAARNPMPDRPEPDRDEQQFGHASLVPRNTAAPARQPREARIAMILLELRSSLRALRTATRVLDVPQAGTLANENAQVLIEHELRQMSRFIDDLLEASRTRTRDRLAHFRRASAPVAGDRSPS